MSALGPEINHEFWQQALQKNKTMDSTFWAEITQSASKAKLSSKDIAPPKLNQLRESVAELSINDLRRIHSHLYLVQTNEINTDLKSRYQLMLDIFSKQLAMKEEYSKQMITSMQNDFNEYKENTKKAKPTFKESQQMRVFEYNIDGYQDDPRLDESVKKEANKISNEMAKLKPPPVPPRNYRTAIKTDAESDKTVNSNSPKRPLPIAPLAERKTTQSLSNPPPKKPVKRERPLPDPSKLKK